jgi:hypothetical protein
MISMRKWLRRRTGPLPEIQKIWLEAAHAGQYADR